MGKTNAKDYLGVSVGRLPDEAAAGVFYYGFRAVKPELQLPTSVYGSSELRRRAAGIWFTTNLESGYVCGELALSAS
jgi:hypothetical protein